MSKNTNSFAQSLKAQIVSLFPSLPISTGKNVAGIDVNDRSAWIRGTVPAAVAQQLKDAGFIACSKGFYFVHDGTKMPKFAPAKQNAPVKAQKPTVKAEKPEKPAKQWVELPENQRKQIARTFEKAYPGCIVEIRGTWVYLIGGIFQTNEEYRARAKADGFHFGFKSKEWSRALTDAELAVKAEPESKPAPAEKAPAQNVPADVDLLTQLSEIVIKARKGELDRAQMEAQLKAVCPF